MLKIFTLFLVSITLPFGVYAKDYDYEQSKTTYAGESAIIDIGECIPNQKYDPFHDRFRPVVNINVASCSKKVTYTQGCQSKKFWFDSCEKISESEEYSVHESTYTKKFSPSYYNGQSLRLNNTSNDPLDQITKDIFSGAINVLRDQQIRSSLLNDCQAYREKALMDIKRNNSTCPL